jgi:hypothetical protein
MATSTSRSRSRSRSNRANDSERYRGIRRRRRQRGQTFAIFLVLALAGAGALFGVVSSSLADRLTSTDQLAAAAVPPVAAAEAPLAATPTTKPSAAEPSAPPLLRMPGPIPTSGHDTFEYAKGVGRVLGHAGVLRRYRVATEDGSDAEVAEFATAVDLALGDPRSWTSSGQLRLQRVPDGANYDFTVYLATAETAGRMCAAGGTDIRIGGEPYTSCRTPGKVIINLNRWALSVDYLVGAKVPLATYRLYVINHEVGHQLGHSHEQCPGKGKPAPVMQQQTLFLNGCTVNPWPYLDGERYAGPSV